MNPLGWERLAARDRRALLVLIIVGGLVGGWWGVTAPLLDQREMARRAARTLEREQADLQGLLYTIEEMRREIKIQDQQPDPQVLTVAESLLVSLEKGKRPVLQSRAVPVAGRLVPAVALRFDRFPADGLHEVFSRLLASGLFLLDLDLTVPPSRNGLAGTAQFWKSLPH